MELPERESMKFEVIIVGVDPAGLTVAIRLKQVNPELTVVLLKKGGEVGIHLRRSRHRRGQIGRWKRLFDARSRA